MVIQPPPAKCQEAEADCELKLPAGHGSQLLCPGDGRIIDFIDVHSSLLTITKHWFIVVNLVVYDLY